MGTPTNDTWPGFQDLPHATRVEFAVVPGVDLELLLPNLPPALEEPTPLSLVKSLLVYPPEQRLKVQDALLHPWFEASLLILPAECLPPRAEGSAGDSIEDILLEFL
jgi:cyclin-dependent kinase 8/11